jgi:hypothetical protein
MNGHGRKRTSALAYDAIAGLFTDVLAVNPALNNSAGNAAVTAGMNFLSRRLGERGKLVVYGFSAGGFNALRLAERVGAAAWRPRAINLLITIDPCLQLQAGHGEFSTQSPSVAIRHVNFYQRCDDVRGRSTPGAALDERLDLPTMNRDRSDITHDRMPVITLDRVLFEIRSCLDAKAVRAAWAPA